MSDKLADWLRTVVPALWSSLVAWLVVKQLLPAALSGWANGLGAVVAVPLVLGAVYAGLRWFEAQHWVPDWLTRILLGSARVPAYPPTGATAASADGSYVAINSATPLYFVERTPAYAPTIATYPPMTYSPGVTTTDYPIKTVPTPPTEPPTPPSGPAGASPPAK